MTIADIIKETRKMLEPDFISDYELAKAKSVKKKRTCTKQTHALTAPKTVTSLNS